MFLDASALVAILTNEPEAEDLLDRIRLSRPRLVSAMCVFEAGLAIARIKRIEPEIALGEVQRFCLRIDAENVVIGADTGEMAVRAHARFGRGRHKAGLNMGDCFAYACAKQAGAKLLYKGDDFAQTDLA
jgi:ribonuclease VapC